MVNRFVVAAVAACSLAGCASDMGVAGGPAAVGGMTPVSRDAYVDLAGASDQFEIQSSHLALSRARSPAVRTFAQMMIDHHTQTTAQLTAAATASGVMPQPRLLPVQQRMLGRLQNARPGQFDRIYMRQQVRAHDMALALHANYARSGDTPELRAVASAATPLVRGHLEQAQRLD